MTSSQTPTTQESLAALAGSWFHKGKLSLWGQDLTTNHIWALEAAGLMTHEFFKHCWGHTDFILTPAGEQAIKAQGVEVKGI